ncbi:MAG: DNA repair protein RadC [Termitinemataceae bacterium]|nr:MAG: DNA repair protein RadC [Termitinemataceae bacterium]
MKKEKYFGNLYEFDALDDAGNTTTPTHLPPSSRPRERLLENGPHSLSDRELLSIMLNTGVSGKNVNVLAAEILDKLHSQKDIPSVKELSAISGIGNTKSSVIVAMMEFGRRHWGNRGIVVRTGKDVYDLIRHYAYSKQEHFLSISLNGAHEVIEVRVVTVGLVNRTIVHPREVFADIIQDRASAICVAHNHPSGLCGPSPEDDEITALLEKAAEILGIQFLDHIIFTQQDFFSYRKFGKLTIQAAH